MDLGQGHHILALETLTSPDALFVVLLEAHLAQVLDQGDEDVLRVVLLEGEVPCGQLGRGGVLLPRGDFRDHIPAFLALALFLLLLD